MFIKNKDIGSTRGNCFPVNKSFSFWFLHVTAILSPKVKIQQKKVIAGKWAATFYEQDAIQ